MRLGLIVNPLAGLGGPLGFKGSDGPLAAAALAVGAASVVAERTGLALSALAGSGVEIVTSGGAMGGDVATAAGLPTEIVHRAGKPISAPADTSVAATLIADRGIDVLLFAGGDGTACDVMAAIGERVPVLGIPAGVKMHSAVFATSPRAAGALLADLVARGGCGDTILSEVLDRTDDGQPQLHGVMRTPADRQRMQGRKAISGSDAAEVEAACRAVVRQIADDAVTIIGPGATMQQLKTLIGIEGTLLGVDAVSGGRSLATDADAATLRSLAAGRRARLVLGVVGGQGFLLGRGNQQIAAAIVRAVGREDVIVIASASKLAALPGGRLLVDTGDAAVDAQLAGYIQVHTGGGKRAMMRVDAA